MTADENDYADGPQRKMIIMMPQIMCGVLSAQSALSKLSAVQTMEHQLKTNTALQMSKIPFAGKDAGVEFRTI